MSGALPKGAPSGVYGLGAAGKGGVEGAEGRGEWRDVYVGGGRAGAAVDIAAGDIPDPSFRAGVAPAAGADGGVVVGGGVGGGGVGGGANGGGVCDDTDDGVDGGGGGDNGGGGGGGGGVSDDGAYCGDAGGALAAVSVVGAYPNSAVIMRDSIPIGTC